MNQASHVSVRGHMNHDLQRTASGGWPDGNGEATAYPYVLRSGPDLETKVPGPRVTPESSSLSVTVTGNQQTPHVRLGLETKSVSVISLYYHATVKSNRASDLTAQTITINTQIRHVVVLYHCYYYYTTPP